MARFGSASKSWKSWTAEKPDAYNIAVIEKDKEQFFGSLLIQITASLQTSSDLKIFSGRLIGPHTI